MKKAIALLTILLLLPIAIAKTQDNTGLDNTSGTSISVVSISSTQQSSGGGSGSGLNRMDRCMVQAQEKLGIVTMNDKFLVWEDTNLASLLYRTRILNQDKYFKYCADNMWNKVKSYFI